MATAARLTASTRAGVGKGAARSLRREGRTPAVIYGHKREPQALAIETRELERLLDRFPIGGTVVELALDGRTYRTLIREVQRHPVKRLILHVDFQELVAGEKVVTKVPLRFHGTPEGVRVGGGVLEEHLHELTIEVDPANLPPQVDVDVSGLGVGKTLHVGDLTLPAGVTVMDDAEAPVATVLPPRVHEEAESAEPTSGEPELIRKPKEEEE